MLLPALGAVRQNLMDAPLVCLTEQLGQARQCLLTLCLSRQQCPSRLCVQGGAGELHLVDALKVRDPDLSAVFVPFRLEREGLPA